MPSSERWHCVLTPTEREVGAGVHLFDWRPYDRSWGEGYVSTRQPMVVEGEKLLFFLWESLRKKRGAEGINLANRINATTSNRLLERQQTKEPSEFLVPDNL